MEEIIKIIVTAIITATLLPNAIKYIKNHFFVDASLLWTVNQESCTVEDETKTLIELRNAGKVSVENYPILVKFTLGAEIYETFSHIIPPEKNYSPLEEPEELRKQYRKGWKRAYRVNLAPKDILQLHFKSSGKDGEPPSVWSIGELLDQSQKDIFFAKDDAQAFLHKLTVAYPIASKLLGTPGGGLWQTVSLIILLTLSMVLVRNGLLGEFNTPVEYAALLLGVSLLSSIGFIIFRLRVWSYGIGIILWNRPVGASRVPGFLISLTSFSYVLGVIMTAIVTTLEFYDRHDLVVDGLSFIVTEMGKFVNALAH